jgi:transcriptional regulator with XRE-family HTH domain
MSAAVESSVGVMDGSLHNANLNASGKVSGIADAFGWLVFYNANMTERPRNHLRAWREFRKMTQEQLADAVGTDKGVISLLESGARGLSDKWLRRLAPVLGTSAGHLLDHDPNELPTDIIDIWSEIAERDKATARRVLESFRRTG